MKTCLSALIFLLSSAALAQTPAPTAPCDLSSLPASTPTRIVQGADSAPFHYACEPKNGCVAGELYPGQVVAIGPEHEGWACVSHSAESGWTPAARLAPIPAAPSIPLAAWIGKWHKSATVPARVEDSFEIAPGASPGSLRIAGRAFWFGRPGNVHFGGIAAQAAPTGLYLRFVEGADLSGCILDLRYDPTAHSIAASDNRRCGGLHVSFSGTWVRDAPVTQAQNLPGSAPQKCRSPRQNVIVLSGMQAQKVDPTQD